MSRPLLSAHVARRWSRSAHSGARCSRAALPARRRPALAAVRHRRARHAGIARRPRRPVAGPVRHRKSSSTGRTGRSTSTSTTRPQKHPTLDAFQQQTGIKVNYTEDVNDNDEFFAKIKPQLAPARTPAATSSCLTDWMAARLIRLGWVQKLDQANIPNADEPRRTPADVASTRAASYSLPWQSGFTGIAYNPKSTGGKKVESIDQLLTDPTLKGKVTLLTEMRDTVGLMMLDQGKDPANFTDDDFDAAIDGIQKAKSTRARSAASPATTTRKASRPATSPPAWPGPATWSSCRPTTRTRATSLPEQRPHDVVGQHPDPEQGAAQEERRDAHQLLLRPEGRGRVAAYVNYICPGDGRQGEPA